MIPSAIDDNGMRNVESIPHVSNDLPVDIVANHLLVYSNVLGRLKAKRMTSP